jgi:hypothetical protein
VGKGHQSLGEGLGLGPGEDHVLDDRILVHADPPAGAPRLTALAEVAPAGEDFLVPRPGITEGRQPVTCGIKMTSAPIVVVIRTFSGRFVRNHVRDLTPEATLVVVAVGMDEGEIMPMIL